MSIKDFFRAPITYTRTWIATSNDPINMSLAERQKTVDLIMKLANRLGYDTAVSDRYQFSRETISQAPCTSGVYRIFDKDELVWIGKSNNLRRRLGEHFVRTHNPDLAELISSKQAWVEWFVCPMPGWLECYELTAYFEKHKELPSFNQVRGGALWS